MSKPVSQHVHDWNTPIEGSEWVCSCGETKPVERGQSGSILVRSIKGETGDHWIQMPKDENAFIDEFFKRFVHAP